MNDLKKSLEIMKKANAEDKIYTQSQVKEKLKPLASIVNSGLVNRYHYIDVIKNVLNEFGIAT